MTDDFELNERAQAWIEGLRRHYRGQPLDEARAAEAPMALNIGGFKMM